MNIFKQTLEKMKQQQQILAMLVFAFVAVIIWITVNLFTSQQKTGISKDLLKFAKPLIPTINQEVVQQLKEQGVFPDSQLQDFPIYMVIKDRSQIERIVEIGTEPEPTPSLSPSPNPSPSSEATSSATNTNNN